MPYGLLFLDADGTLFDYDAAESEALVSTLAPLLSEEDLARAPAIYRRINQGIWLELERREITQAELAVERFRRLFRELGNEAGDAGELSRRYLDELALRSRLLDGAEETVRGLAARHRLVLVTNGLARVQRPRVERSAVASCFAALVISDEVGIAKPDPAILAYACSLVGERAGVRERRTMLMIGDSLKADVAAGAAFGIDTCWFNPSRQPSGGWPQPTYEISRLEELHRIAG